MDYLHRVVGGGIYQRSTYLPVLLEEYRQELQPP